MGVNKLSSDASEDVKLCDEAQLSANSDCASMALYRASHISKLVCIGGLRSVVDGLKVVVYVVHSADCLLRKLSKIWLLSSGDGHCCG